jgi:hypothetical protein
MVKRLGCGTAAVAVATALAGGLGAPASAATAGCSVRGCHQLMVKVPADATLITIISGTLVDGTDQGLACYSLPAHGDGDWVGTGLEMRDRTRLSIGLEGNTCDRPLGNYGTWSGSVPVRDGRDNLWIMPGWGLEMNNTLSRACWPGSGCSSTRRARRGG